MVAVYFLFKNRSYMSLLLKSGSKPELNDCFVYKNNGLAKTMIGLRERIVILALLAFCK